jgi:hypothetical protein
VLNLLALDGVKQQVDNAIIELRPAPEPEADGGSSPGRAPGRRTSGGVG